MIASVLSFASRENSALFDPGTTYPSSLQSVVSEKLSSSPVFQMNFAFLAAFFTAQLSYPYIVVTNIISDLCLALQWLIFALGTLL